MAWFEREFTKKLSPEKIYFPSARGLLLLMKSGRSGPFRSWFVSNEPFATAFYGS